MEINFLVKGTQFGLEIYPGQQAEITHKMTFKFLAWSDVNLGMLIAWTFPPNLQFTLQIQYCAFTKIHVFKNKKKKITSPLN